MALVEFGLLFRIQHSLFLSILKWIQVVSQENSRWEKCHPVAVFAALFSFLLVPQTDDCWEIPKISSEDFRLHKSSKMCQTRLYFCGELAGYSIVSSNKTHRVSTTTSPLQTCPAMAKGSHDCASCAAYSCLETEPHWK